MVQYDFLKSAELQLQNTTIHTEYFEMSNYISLITAFILLFVQGPCHFSPPHIIWNGRNYLLSGIKNLEECKYLQVKTIGCLLDSF